MPLIDQLISASYNDVVNEARKPENQWADSTALNELEKLGYLKRIKGGPQIEVTLDYRRNPGAEFQSTDMQATSTVKTEVLTSALFDPAQLSSPITWSVADEAKNPDTNQKVDLVESLVTNALTTHDELIEEAIFAADTNGFLGLATIVPDDGQGTVGTISAATEVWWRNWSDTYLANYTDLLATMNQAWNEIVKGSGSSMKPKMLLSGPDAATAYEGTQTGLIRYIDTKEADAGFKVLAYKTARYSFSQYGDDHIYFLGAKSFSIDVFKNHFRKLGEKEPILGQNAFYRNIFSLLQSKTNNKSRNGVIRSA